MSVGLADLGIICTLGDDKSSVLATVISPTSRPQTCLSFDQQLSLSERNYWVGKVRQPLPMIVEPQFNTRNNQLIRHAFEQIQKNFERISQHVDPQRIAVIMGTSTSGIDSGEAAREKLLEGGQFPNDFHYSQQELNAPAEYIAHLAGAKGVRFGISTACSSSGKALLSAKALIEADFADVVLCGGVDSLCKMTVNGFSALDSTAHEFCQPFAAERDGINIAEGAALFIMTRESGAVNLLGGGASSDAYHVSAPEPSGTGAIAAMELALQQANLSASEIDYVNAHGTGTLKNDAMESTALATLFGACVPVSSTKALTGHTLGAAGAIEAGICWLLLSELNPHQRLPVHFGQIDPACDHIMFSQGNAQNTLQSCLSNSFAFGGNNVALVLGN